MDSGETTDHCQLPSSLSSVIRHVKTIVAPQRFGRHVRVDRSAAVPAGETGKFNL